MTAMTPAEIVSEFQALGGTLFPGDGDLLKVRAPEAPPVELLGRLRAHKLAILAYLKSRPTCAECGGAIVGPVMATWGGSDVHRDCGERAWRREFQAVPDERKACRDEIAA